MGKALEPTDKEKASQKSFNQYARPVKVWNTDTKTLIQKFESQKQCSQYLKIHHRDIARYIQKKTKFYSEIYKANITLR